MNRRDILKLWGVAPVAIPMVMKAAVQPKFASGGFVHGFSAASRPLPLPGETILPISEARQFDRAARGRIISARFKNPLNIFSVEQQMLDHDVFDMRSVT